MIGSLFDDRRENLRSKAMLTCALLVVANIGVWTWAWVAFSSRPALLGTALLAYTFGLRHAFDADHIAAIDNVVRKLIQEKRAPFSAGLFFALGHSTIVVLASLAIAVMAATLQGRLMDFHDLGSTIGTSISAIFLFAIGIANLITLKGVWRAFSKARKGGAIVEEDLEALLAGHGFLARVFRPMFCVVTRSWHMYPLGFLFGLGFDTATEIGLLGISAAQAAAGTSFWTILVFPALFTAGMSLLDTIDSMFMTRAYGWAFVRPIRKLWYNMTITAASVLVAVFVGGVEALGLVVGRLGLDGGLWSVAGRLNDSLTTFGYAVVGIFVASWLISALIYKLKGYDDIATMPAP